MKTLFNSIFRSFSYQLGKLIFWLLIGALAFLIFGNRKVEAFNLAYDFKGSDGVNSVNLANCTNAGCTSTTNIGIGDWLNSGYSTTSAFTPNATHGIRVQMRFSQAFQKDFTYSIGVMVCTNTTYFSTHEAGIETGTSTTSYKPANILLRQAGQLDTISFPHPNGALSIIMQKCNLMYYTFVPEESGMYLNMRLMPVTTGSITSGSFVVYGLASINNLGYYDTNTSSQLTQIMNTQNTFNTIQNEIKNQNEELNNIYTDDTENEDGTCGGIVCNLKKVVKGVIDIPSTIFNAIINSLKSLFIPSDTNFITNFVQAIENKLGFIGTIPAQIIQFGLNLLNASYTEMSSIQFPKLNTFGVSFWGDLTIDLTEGKKMFAPIKYIGNVTCVVIMVNALVRYKEKFTGGGD